MIAEGMGTIRQGVGTQVTLAGFPIGHGTTVKGELGLDGSDSVVSWGGGDGTNLIVDFVSNRPTVLGIINVGGRGSFVRRIGSGAPGNLEFAD